MPIPAVADTIATMTSGADRRALTTVFPAQVSFNQPTQTVFKTSIVSYYNFLFLERRIAKHRSSK